VPENRTTIRNNDDKIEPISRDAQAHRKGGIQRVLNVDICLRLVRWKRVRHRRNVRPDILGAHLTRASISPAVVLAAWRAVVHTSLIES